MRISINNTSYTQIKNLSFSPEADITGSKMPINGFSADIVTDTDPGTGVNVMLYDDQNNLWANYWVTESQRVSEGVVHIEARSALRLLDQKKKNAVMYDEEPLTTILDSIFTGSLSNAYLLDVSFGNKTISGYCPKQTAKERLQWICFTIGAYIKTFFTQYIEILPVDSVVTVIPMNKTYWKPSVSYEDYVTSVSVTAYSYTQGTPQTTDTWVKAGGNYYIETQQEFTLDNPEAPQDASENIISVDNITIVNEDNVSDIVSLLSTYYFKRVAVDAEVINNAEFIPGEKVSLATDEQTEVTGFINSADFTFGLQAKAKIHISQADLKSSAVLTIVRKYSNTTLRKDKYFLPLSYQYSIENPYIDLTKNRKRRIYRPLNKYATGTMSSSKMTNTQNYEIALEFKDSVLKILSVDEVNVQTSSGDQIGVID